MPVVLTETFDVTQYDPTLQNPIPEDCIDMIHVFHASIMVHVIQKFGTLIPTSGNRSVKNNTAAHGQPNSEHLYTFQHCALDFYSPNVPARVIFDWMRLNPSLCFHQLILEHGATGFTIVHVSMNVGIPFRFRSVLEGATHNSEEYAKVDHVAWGGPNNHDAVQDATAG